MVKTARMIADKITLCAKIMDKPPHTFIKIKNRKIKIVNYSIIFIYVTLSTPPNGGKTEK